MLLLFSKSSNLANYLKKQISTFKGKLKSLSFLLELENYIDKESNELVKEFLIMEKNLSEIF